MGSEALRCPYAGPATQFCACDFREPRSAISNGDPWESTRMALVASWLFAVLAVEPVGDLVTTDPPEDAVMGDGIRGFQIDPPTQEAVCADSTTLDGIDVSKWNGAVDWAKVAAAGTDFAFVRVSDGINTPDPRFAENWQNARAAGIA